jgi:uncharacterized membrane protein
MTASQRAAAAFFCVAGALHFVRPRAYEAIMPPYVPRPRDAVQLSGAAEIVGGVAMLAPATRGFARWWLLALLAAVFPANVHMVLHPDAVAAKGVPADRIPAALLWLRLPVQGLLAGWVWRATAN